MAELFLYTLTFTNATLIVSDIAYLSLLKAVEILIKNWLKSVRILLPFNEFKQRYLHKGRVYA